MTSFYWYVWKEHFMGNCCICLWKKGIAVLCKMFLFLLFLLLKCNSKDIHPQTNVHYRDNLFITRMVTTFIKLFHSILYTSTLMVIDDMIGTFWDWIKCGKCILYMFEHMVLVKYLFDDAPGFFSIQLGIWVLHYVPLLIKC